jgi:hypothetical protein
MKELLIVATENAVIVIDAFARHAEPVDTSTSHVGFRCVIRERKTR